MNAIETAAPGAPPAVQGAVPLIVPEINGNEWTYVRECLDTGWVSSVGSYVDRFERAFEEGTGARHAVATVNGTSALHTALLVAGVRPGDEVIVSTLTFIAPVNAIRYAGAFPVFLDADWEYWQMDVAKLAHFLEHECRRGPDGLFNRTTGRRVAAIVPVHILGHPVDMDPVLELGRAHGLPVIEDATESLGARYRGRPVGHLGDIGCFSFNGNKIITTGGGGMLVTDRSDWAERARYLTTQAKDDPIEYIHSAVGYNYRLTNVLAAIGCAQMEKLPEFIARKRRIAARYAAALADLPGLIIPREAPWAFSTYWMYTILVDPARAGFSSRDLLKALAARRIQTRPLWQPIHQSPAHRDGRAWQCPTAEWLNDVALSLPCSAGLADEDQDRVIEAIRSMYSRGCGA